MTTRMKAMWYEEQTSTRKMEKEQTQDKVEQILGYGEAMMKMQDDPEIKFEVLQEGKSWSS